MNPSVYLYNEVNNVYKIYLGECSVLDGLSLIEKSQEIVITNFGATLYKDYGWATEAELPLLKNVGEVIAFLETEGELGIIDFEASLSNLCKFSSHDDGECTFTFESKNDCIATLKLAAPLQYSDMLINQLINNKGLYLTCSSNGAVNKYSSFTEYCEKNT
ncbi:hypothetical protein EUZ85_18680 [Hahella sp. KA22]|uniref:hypothetical protein n=1 Tax=Hahella sp. KA22 TaxID=1628392 RepID=UPI000FDECBBF|nr:hypothetical protein [Hahella sp. KA22]AZZ92639.1 hypothetical protein ENC22_16105 [Hahella sp. KA22]QAY56012.1 hypothetical protein EUZ85_18680 [Hahella sp. KA22]